ncbi:hypothetical protein PCYB_005760 [Plasmodium cynomolgi strain B]|uniref:CYIR protein n=1 Tax=Plasmodium cynomolgi (strain B) TaxID=1120755 RepID=K6VK56_PLACD|nr:hypothetical protein PCYB_005760 [Plasmodium cynomolgi strain B]GAB69827.1 hypothetical protein PCYB_005760 [Plasmodium cynomolgi strain B]
MKILITHININKILILHQILKLQNNVLGLLPSFSNYKKLENWSHLGLEDICSALKNDIKSVPDFYDICMNIIGVLEYLEYPVSFTLYDNKKCTVFALWMYDYLIKYFKNDDNYSKTRAVIEIMNERFSKYSEKLGCKIPSYINNETHVDNLKKLYDYATNYDTILHHITDKGNKCSQEYSKYIKERIDLLKKVKSDCYDKSENHCEVYKNIFGSSIDEKFFSLQCNSLGSQEISAITETSHVQEGKEQITNDGTTKTIYSIRKLDKKSIKRKCKNFA